MIRCDERNRLFLHGGATCSCCCWPAVNTVCVLHSGGQRTPKVIAVCQRYHSTLFPFLMVCHCLFVNLKWQHSCIILVFPAALTQCSTTSALCNIALWRRAYCGNDLGHIQRQWQIKIKPNIQNTVNDSFMHVKRRVPLRIGLANEFITT